MALRVVSAADTTLPRIACALAVSDAQALGMGSVIVNGGAAGINAHISHDRSEAIVAGCAVTNTLPERSAPQFSDYTSLNATLNSINGSHARPSWLACIIHIR
jgi:hypothetical protein